MIYAEACYDVLRIDGHDVEFADADGVVARADIRDLQEDGYTAAHASRAVKANGDVLHFVLDADRRVTSTFLNGVVIPPVTGGRYAGPA